MDLPLRGHLPLRGPTPSWTSYPFVASSSRSVTSTASTVKLIGNALTSFIPSWTYPSVDSLPSWTYTPPWTLSSLASQRTSTSRPKPSSSVSPPAPPRASTSTRSTKRFSLCSTSASFCSTSWTEPRLQDQHHVRSFLQIDADATTRTVSFTSSTSSCSFCSRTFVTSCS